MSDQPQDPSDPDQPTHTDGADESGGDLPTRPAAEAKPGEDAGGVADTGAPTDPEHPTG